MGVAHTRDVYEPPDYQCRVRVAMLCIGPAHRTQRLPNILDVSAQSLRSLRPTTSVKLELNFAPFISDVRPHPGQIEASLKHPAYLIVSCLLNSIPCR
ncbi:hypothetical protein JB92DRAFT_872165 [Gautieria morchelliformis]|nr:hypothetical protein JB92DRAFT_872165 [Gautieria morchelliformis]